MATQFSTTTGYVPSVEGGSSYADNIRRTYDLRDLVKSYLPKQNLYLQYLINKRRVPTPDPKFIMMEERQQIHRRYFRVQQAATGIAVASPNVSGLRLKTDVDRFGIEKQTYSEAPIFLVPKQTLGLEAEIDTGAGGTYVPCKVNARVVAVGAAAAGYTPVDIAIRAVNGDTAFATTYAGKTLRFSVDQKGLVIGSAWAESTDAPDGWLDELYSREGYAQLFKTGVPMFSGTSMATVYRGRPDEWVRMWAQKMPEHRLDITRSFLFEVGRYGSEDGVTPSRFTWGIIPYTEKYGLTTNMQWASSGYNQFSDFLEYYLHPDRGNNETVPLALCSRKFLKWLNRLGDEGFMKSQLVGKAVLNYSPFSGAFGHQLIRLQTIWGDIAFGEEQALNRYYEDTLVLVNLNTVAYRPLVGNGKSRDTLVTTNVQNPGVDGRKDQILTEVGQQIDTPEKNAVITFS